MQTPLTVKQDVMLKAIKAYIRRHDFPPTQAELKGMLKIKTKNSVWQTLKELEKKGAISRDKGKSRGITVR